MELQSVTRNAGAHTIALIASAVYGITIRAALSHPTSHAGQLAGGAVWLMTLGFLFLVPYAMGYISVATLCSIQRQEGHAPPGVAQWIFFPWLPAVAAMLVAALFAWEGSICLLFAAPVVLIMASVGGVSAALSQRRRFRPAQLSAVALLPLLMVLFETQVPDPASYRTVDTAIRIHAPAAAVWANVARVPSILQSELPRSWVTTIGFPRPVEATLSHEGVGGVRRASFTGGLVFTETIDRWDALQDLAFSIHANAASIPPTTLDEHVKVGGRYFDVLEGEYRLTALPHGETLLHLSSRERVSTHFNGYAGWWTDCVMRSIQNSILVVVKRRAEAQTALQSHVRMSTP